MKSQYLKGLASRVAFLIMMIRIQEAGAQVQTSFWLGVSYFGALGDRTNPPHGPGFNVQRDLDHLGALGYKLIRVWATWDMPSPIAASLILADGSVNPGVLERLKGLITYADNKGLQVDLTFSYRKFTGPIGGTGFNAYKTGIANATRELKASAYSNVIFDLCNECPLSPGQIRQLIDTVRSLHPGRKVFVSFSDPDPIHNVINIARKYNRLGRRLDYLAPHFFRNCSSAWATQTRSRLNAFRMGLNPSYLAIPIYLQEENRRHYAGDGCDSGPPRKGNGYEPSPNDFDTASSQAQNNGANSAQAWVLHTRAGFNLSAATLCRQLDPVELNLLYDLPCHRLGICLPRRPCP